RPELPDGRGPRLLLPLDGARPADGLRAAGGRRARARPEPRRLRQAALRLRPRLVPLPPQAAPARPARRRRALVLRHAHARGAPLLLWHVAHTAGFAWEWARTRAAG